MNKKDSKKIKGIFFRYTIVLILGIGNLYLVYKVLTPLTIHTTNIILNIFHTTSLINNTIHLGQTNIEIISACVAGSAFYFLIFLFLSIPDINPRKRFFAILMATATLFVLNILRILSLSFLTSSPYFEIIHWASWHMLSILIVVGIYIAITRIYNIKGVPIYSDIKYLRNLTIHHNQNS